MKQLSKSKYAKYYLVYPQLGTEIEPYLQRNHLLLSDYGVSSIWQYKIEG